MSHWLTVRPCKQILIFSTTTIAQLESPAHATQIQTYSQPMIQAQAPGAAAVLAQTDQSIGLVTKEAPVLILLAREEFQANATNKVENGIIDRLYATDKRTLLPRARLEPVYIGVAPARAQMRRRIGSTT